MALAMLPQAVSDHYRAQQRLTLATLSLVRREWARMGDDLDASWARVGPRIVALTTAAQVGAAKDGAAYVPEALAQQGIDAPTVGRANPAAFAGVATDLDGLTYGSLDALLYGSVVHARTADTKTLSERLKVGGSWLEALVHTQLADAARMSASTTISATHGMGYVRMVNPPCCQRCAVLAGKFVKSETPFPRHPQCDCRHVPTDEAHADSVGYVIGPDDVKDLTWAQRQAISDGADMNQVINAHRHGSRSKDLMTTTEGSTVRGVAGKRLAEASGAEKQGGSYRVARQARLTPKGIYKVSATREEALQRLRDNGYLL